MDTSWLRDWGFFIVNIHVYWRNGYSFFEKRVLFEKSIIHGAI